MSWTHVIGQQRIVQALQRVIDTERVAHAYLFHGKDGVGKRAVALALAQALLCETGRPIPCGTCNACHKVERLIHPDVHVLIPQPNDADTADVTARLQRLAEHPYATIDYLRRPSLRDPEKTSSKQATYTVGRINEVLRRTMSFRPVEGRYKVAILTDAHLLRTEAANAFLKLLEEPGAQTLFLLLTDRVDRLLPTIVSRCQRLRFEPLDTVQIEQALVQREGLDPDRAATIARMADGAYSRALDLAENEDLLAGRELVIDFFRLAYVHNIDKLADHIEQVSRLGREPVKGLLDLMLRWIRDLMLYRTLGAAAPIVNIDQAEAIAKFCTHVPKADLEAMVRLVEEARELVERNVQLGLIWTVLAQAVGQAMQGPHPGRLYVPLAEPPAVALSA